MSSLKIPTQIPWVVAAVVVAHGILAIFLFGGTGEATRQPRSAKTEITLAKNDTDTSGSATHSAHSPHPLGKKTGSNSSTTADANSKHETFGEADNAHFEPRFPKRIPRQSELNAAVAATDGPVTAEDIFKITQAEKQKGAVEKPNPASQAADDEAEKKGSGTFSLPSAVAAAKAAPFSKSGGSKTTAKSADKSEHRLRMVERTVPVAGPRPMSTKRDDAVQPEPIAETSAEPKLRFKSTLPSVSKIKPIKRNTVPQIRAENRPSPPPVQPSNQRKFRVVKPLPR